MVKNLASTLLGVSWSFTVAASIMMGLRIYCRRRFLDRLWWDDWWMSLSLMFSWAMAATWTAYAALGATSYAPVSPERMIQIKHVNWISQCWNILSLMTSKVAIAALIARLQSPCKWRTYVLWIVSAINLAWGTSEIILIWTQCRPLNKLFDESVPGRCLAPEILVYNAQACSAYWAFLDLFLAALPVQMIWNLQMDRKKKIIISCILSTGVFAFATAVVKTCMLGDALGGHPDMIKDSVNLFVWNAVETGVVIMAGCVPAITPLFNGVVRRRSSTYPVMESRASSVGKDNKKRKIVKNWFDRSLISRIEPDVEDKSWNSSQTCSVSGEGHGSYRAEMTVSPKASEANDIASNADGLITVTRDWHVETLPRSPVTRDDPVG